MIYVRSKPSVAELPIAILIVRAFSANLDSSRIALVVVPVSISLFGVDNNLGFDALVYDRSGNKCDNGRLGPSIVDTTAIAFAIQGLSCAHVDHRDDSLNLIEVLKGLNREPVEEVRHGRQGVHQFTFRRTRLELVIFYK